VVRAMPENEKPPLCGWMFIIQMKEEKRYSPYYI